MLMSSYQGEYEKYSLVMACFAIYTKMYSAIIYVKFWPKIFLDKIPWIMFELEQSQNLC